MSEKKFRQYNIRLTEEQISFLKSLPNASQFVRQALNEAIAKETKSIFSILRQIEQASQKIAELKRNDLYQVAKANLNIIENASEKEYPLEVYLLDTTYTKVLLGLKDKPIYYKQNKEIIEAFQRNMKKLRREINKLQQLLAKT